MRMRSMEKPVLAAINGVAAGAGLSLALACDLRYAAESTRLVVAFVKIGLVPDAGCLYFLPRLVGPGKALEMSWTGDPVGAQEAYALGLVNKVLPDDQVLTHTQAVAAKLACGPAATLGLIKRAINQSHELPSSASSISKPTIKPSPPATPTSPKASPPSKRSARRGLPIGARRHRSGRLRGTGSASSERRIPSRTSLMWAREAA